MLDKARVKLRANKRFKRTILPLILSTKTVLGVVAFKAVENAIHATGFDTLALAALAVLSAVAPGLVLLALQADE
jgi:hypothetical protein